MPPIELVTDFFGYCSGPWSARFRRAYETPLDDSDEEGIATKPKGPPPSATVQPKSNSAPGTSSNPLVAAGARVPREGSVAVPGRSDGQKAAFLSSSAMPRAMDTAGRPVPRVSPPQVQMRQGGDPRASQQMSPQGGSTPVSQRPILRAVRKGQANGNAPSTPSQPLLPTPPQPQKQQPSLPQQPVVSKPTPPSDPKRIVMHKPLQTTTVSSDDDVPPARSPLPTTTVTSRGHVIHRQTPEAAAAAQRLFPEKDDMPPLPTDDDHLFDPPHTHDPWDPKRAADELTRTLDEIPRAYQKWIEKSRKCFATGNDFVNNEIKIREQSAAGFKFPVSEDQRKLVKALTTRSDQMRTELKSHLKELEDVLGEMETLRRRWSQLYDAAFNGGGSQALTALIPKSLVSVDQVGPLVEKAVLLFRNEFTLKMTSYHWVFEKCDQLNATQLEAHKSVWVLDSYLVRDKLDTILKALRLPEAVD